MGWRLELRDVPWMTVEADIGSDGAIWGRGSVLTLSFKRHNKTFTILFSTWQDEF